MLKRWFFLSVCVLLSLSAAAENLFIETHPGGASVYLDDQLLAKKTPLKLENVSPGLHKLKIIKSDFKILETGITISENETAVFVQQLDYDFIVQRFPGEQEIMFNGTIQTNKDQLYRLPDGNYRIERKEGMVNITSVYDHEWAIKGLIIGTSIIAAATANSVIQDIFTQNGQFRLSAESLIGISGTAAAGAMLAGFLINKAGFEKNLPYTLEAVPPSDEVALDYLNRGEEAFASGDFNEAQQWFLMVMENQPESRYYPNALYQMAKTHYLGSNDALAVAELKLLEERFPTAELYDRTCKTLADVLFRMGEYSESISYLEKMEFIDLLYSREEISEYIRSIQELIE